MGQYFVFRPSDWPLALDSYQRGFVWGPDKLTQLVSDLAAYVEQADTNLPYYRGERR